MVVVNIRRERTAGHGLDYVRRGLPVLAVEVSASGSSVCQQCSAVVRQRGRQRDALWRRGPHDRVGAQAGAGGNRREREGGREAEHGVLLMEAAEDRSTGTSGTATVTTVYSTSLFFN